jgi:hypothetical protein
MVLFENPGKGGVGGNHGRMGLLGCRIQRARVSRDGREMSSDDDVSSGSRGAQAKAKPQRRRTQNGQKSTALVQAKLNLFQIKTWEMEWPPDTQCSTADLIPQIQIQIPVTPL